MRCFLVFAVASAADWGIVNLDNATLPLLVGGQFGALVRLDREYPYGDKHDAFKAVAKAVAESGSGILVGHVGVSTWGDRDNNDLAVKYAGVSATQELAHDDMENMFPKFRWFPKGAGAEAEASILYEGDTDKGLEEGLLAFVKKHGNVYFGLPGCLRDFDKLAAKFAGAPEATLENAKTAAAELAEADKPKAANYLKAMEKAVSARGQTYFAEESARLEKIMKGSMSADKRTTMQQKHNVLSSFVSPSEL